MLMASTMKDEREEGVTKSPRRGATKTPIQLQRQGTRTNKKLLEKDAPSSISQRRGTITEGGMVVIPC